MGEITNPEELMGAYTSGAGNEQDKKGSEKDEEKTIFTTKIDTEFPLSGGETEEDWKQATEDVTENDDELEDDEADQAEFERRLDTEFPLSGGEAE